MSEQILAWHGDPDLKARVVAKMKQHREMDEFIQGDYQYTYGLEGEPVKYKGCAIGCTLPYMSRAERSRRTGGDPGEFSWHKEVEKEYGIPVGVALLIDNTFEALDFDEAGDFAVAVIEAIPVGADLSKISCTDRDCGECIDCNYYAEDVVRPLIEALATAPVLE